MFDTGIFNYVDVLGKAADASWMRNEVLSNNISNINTPGYKRQDVDFETQLRHALGNFKYKSVDARVNAINSSELVPRIYTDSVGFSYRLDGNNVDIDTEGAELASNQLRYNGLVTAYNAEFRNLMTVIK